MPALITLEHARRQVGLQPDDTSLDYKLDPLREVASALVIDYIKRPDHGWSESYDPAGSPYDSDFVIATAAIAEVMVNLWRHPGDEAVEGPITARVKLMLERLRDPALA